MRKIAITSDCNAGLDYIGYDPEIPVLRSLINFGDDHYVDGTDIKADEFYEKLKETTLIPSTSAPTLGETMELIERLIDEGYTDIIHFPISFQLSGTGRTFLNLQEEYKDKINIHVFDTKTSCYLQAYLALEAKRLVKEGKSVEEILEHSQILRDGNKAYFVVDDLNYLVKNGRLSGFSGAVGTLLKIKPILWLTPEGKIEAFEKVRTHTKAIEKTLEIVKNELSDSNKYMVVLFHTCREDDVQKIAEYLENELPHLSQKIDIYQVTPAVGAHIGRGIIGIGYFKLDNVKN